MDAGLVTMPSAARCGPVAAAEGAEVGVPGHLVAIDDACEGEVHLGSEPSRRMMEVRRGSFQHSSRSPTEPYVSPLLLPWLGVGDGLISLIVAIAFEGRRRVSADSNLSLRQAEYYIRAVVFLFPN